MVPSGLNWRLAEFERLSDAHDFSHSVQQFEVAVIEIAVNADRAEHRMRFASGAVNVEAAGDQPVDDMLDLASVAPSCITMTISALCSPRLFP